MQGASCTKKDEEMTGEMLGAIATASTAMGDAVMGNDFRNNNPEAVAVANGLDLKRIVRFEVTDNGIDHEKDAPPGTSPGQPYSYSNAMCPRSIFVRGNCGRRVKIHKVVRQWELSDEEKRLGLQVYRRDRGLSKRCRSECKISRRGGYYLLGMYLVHSSNKRIVYLYPRKI